MSKMPNWLKYSRDNAPLREKSSPTGLLFLKVTIYHVSANKKF